MAFDLSKLTNYVDEQRLPLIKKAILGGKTVGLINLQTGVKHSAALNIVEIESALQAGSCGWNAKGDTHLSQRIITAEPLKVNMSFCDKDLLSKWTGYEVKAGLAGDKAPFEEYITTGVVENINESIEHSVWQGDKDVDGQFEGLLTIVDTDAIKVTGTGAYAAIKAAYSAIPVNILSKAAIFVGADTFRSFMLEMVEKNYFHYPADGAKVEEFILPGTNTKVIAVNGLNGSNKVVAADPMNLFYGCDMLDDAEVFDFWYDKSNREYRIAVEFNAGVQVAFPDEVVVATVA